MVFLLYKKSKKKRIQQTLYFKIEQFTVYYLYALLLYALLFTHDIIVLGLTI